MDAAAVIEHFGLVPHPEGGHYRQTFADDSSTAIYYLIGGDDGWSRWHRVLDRTEVWHAYAGAALELETAAAEPGRAQTTVRLGRDLASGDVPQAVVPPGYWQRARSTGPWSLVGCTVSPPFSFDAFEVVDDSP
jgi:predicted cupin superfamily sugar epimerase